MTETWDSADPYERFIGRWSRPVARDFIAWLDAPVGSTWLDVGCGTGALAEAIALRAAPARVDGVDPSAAFVDQAARRFSGPPFSFQVGDAQNLPQADSTYDLAASALVLNFLPDPSRGLAEMMRVTKPGGSVAAYVWDYAGEMQMLRYFWDAAIELRPSARDQDEAVRFPIAQRDSLASLWRQAGLSDVDTTALDVPTHFRDFDDYWEPFLGGQGPAPGYNASLPPEERDRLRAHLRERLPIAADGSIALVARAWAAKGTVPR